MNFGCKQCDHEFGHDDQKASLEAEPARCAVRVGIEHLLEIRVDVLKCANGGQTNIHSLLTRLLNWSREMRSLDEGVFWKASDRQWERGQ